MTTPLRVTQVVFDLDGGGLETLVGDMIRGWAGSAVTSSVVTLSGRAGRVGESVRGLVDQFHTLKPMPLVSMMLPLGLARAIRRTRPDVVHLHSGAWYKSVRAARLCGVPRVIYTEHGREHHDPPLMRLLDRLSSRHTDVVVAVSPRLATYLVDVVGVDAARVRVVANGVDTDRFHPGRPDPSLRQAMGIPKDALVLGSVGRLERVKRYDRLIEALARLPASIGGRPLYLLLCGEGTERPALGADALRLGVADRVRFPGWVTDVPGVNRLFDVFAVTSDSEGMSVSLLEAMASGVAVLVMDVGSNAELVGRDLAELVVPAGDLGAFVERAARMLEDDAYRANVASALRGRVANAWSLRRMMMSYEALYRGLEPAA